MAISYQYYKTAAGVWSTLSAGDVISLSDTRMRIDGLAAGSVTGISLDIVVSQGGQRDLRTVFSRKFFASFDSTVSFDMRDDLADCMELQGINGEEVAEDRSFLACQLKLGTATLSFMVTNNLKQGSGRCTDLDYVRVSRDTVLRFAVDNPIAMLEIEEDADFPEFGGCIDGEIALPVYVKTRRGVRPAASLGLKGWSAQGLLYGRIAVASLPVAVGESFQLLYGPVLDEDSGEELAGRSASPIYRLEAQSSEDYMFLNDYGALDVVPMFGALTFKPEYTFETGETTGGNVRIASQSRKTYAQNTGNMSGRNIEVLADLMCSRQIYHLAGGLWKRILITETNLEAVRLSSRNSFEFKYIYA